MIYPTLLTDSYPCYRKALLKYFFEGKEESSIVLLKGIIIHELF